MSPQISATKLLEGTQGGGYAGVERGQAAALNGGLSGMRSEDGEEFLISKGGPFFELQKQLGLIREKSETAIRRSVVFVMLTALVPLLLELFGRGTAAAADLVSNPDFLARFVLFVAIAVTTERGIDERLRIFLARFRGSGLLGSEGRKQGAMHVTRALQLRNSWLAELLCLIAAIGLSVAPILSASAGDTTAALLFSGDESHKLTAAGWWILCVSGPIFWFLTLRWVWRITLWSLLLRWISSLDLRLVVTHPDRSAGISFVGKYPNAFSPIVLAFSFVIAAILLRQMLSSELTGETYGFVMTAWLAIVLIAFLAPLTAFMAPLVRLREETLKEADAIDTRIQRESERKLLGKNLAGPPDDIDGDDEGLPGDPSAFRKAAKDLRVRPFSRDAVIPLSAAALLPLLIAGSSYLPFKELLNIAKKLLLL